MPQVPGEASYIVKRIMNFYVPKAERGKGETSEYREAEVDYCLSCGAYEDPNGVHDMWHGPLCLSRLEAPRRANEQDQGRVLRELFKQASILLGQAPEVALKALAELYEWVPEAPMHPAILKDAKKHNMIAGDEDWEKIPFMSETYLYALLGKEDARTLLARFGAIATALGFERGMGQ